MNKPRLSFSDDELEEEIPADVLYPYEAPYEEYWHAVFNEEHVAYDKFAIKIQRFLKPNLLGLMIYNDREADLLEELEEVKNMTKLDLDYIAQDREERTMAIRLEWEKERMELEEEEGEEDFNKEEEEAAQKKREELGQLIQSLREEISKEEDIASELENQLEQQAEIECRLLELQGEYEERLLMVEEAKEEVEKLAQQLQLLDRERVRVQTQNDNYLTCVQHIAEALERYGMTWIQILEQKSQKKPYIIPEEEEKLEESYVEENEIAWVPPTKFTSVKRLEESLSDLYFSQPDLFGSSIPEGKYAFKVQLSSSQPDLFVAEKKAKQLRSFERAEGSIRLLTTPPRPSLKERHPSKMSLMERSGLSRRLSASQLMGTSKRLSVVSERMGSSRRLSVMGLGHRLGSCRRIL